jgi:hypothetical protein
MSQKVVVDLNVNTGKSKEDVKKVTEQTTDLKDSLRDVETQTKKTNKVLGGIKKVLSGLFIIQGLQVAFDLFKETLNKNQKVVDAFSTATEALSLAFNDFFNYLNSNVGTVVGYFKSIFNDPKQAILDFGNAIVDNLINRFIQLGETLGLVGDAISLLFEGRFVEAQLKIKEAAIESIDVFTGVDNTLEKVADTVSRATDGIIEYTKSTIDAAAGVVELNKQAEVAAVINQGLIEKYDRQAEQQRQLRDDETKTISERIEANNKLGEVLEEQQKLMLENVDITIRAAQAEYNKNQNQENYIALLEAQNEREAVLAQIEGFRSEQIINRISLEKEQADLKKELDEQELERLEEKREKEAEAAKERKQQVYDTLDAVIDAAGAETKVGKALFIAKQAIRIQEQIEQAKATLQELGLIAAKSGADVAAGAASTAKVGFPQNVPLLIAFAGQAAGIISSVKAAVNAAKGSASAMGGGGGSTASAPQAPSFNVVGAAPENQLAQAIGEKEDKPIKAFVVSNDVTNAQALDRNIVEGASLG